jgi:hypothetical protein
MVRPATRIETQMTGTVDFAVVLAAAKYQTAIFCALES